MKSRFSGFRYISKSKDGSGSESKVKAGNCKSSLSRGGSKWSRGGSKMEPMRLKNGVKEAQKWSRGGPKRSRGGSKIEPRRLKNRAEEAQK
jgi:hypothetical protein